MCVGVKLIFLREHNYISDGFYELDWEESANLITKCVDCWVSCLVLGLQ